jgi:hypothetical protein
MEDQVMINTSFRFDLAAILLASALTALGMSAAHAGGASGGVLGDRGKASADRHQAGAQQAGSPARSGGRGGIGGDL